MANKVPQRIRAEVKRIVYDRADAVKYLAQNRIENGLFLDGLAKDPQIREPLMDYMPEANVRTYIKDAILNPYAKERIAELKDSISNTDLLRPKYGEVSELASASSGDVVLYKNQGKPITYVVISEGTCLKWETALRKALEYVTKLSNVGDGSLDIYLKCVSPGPLSVGDKGLLRNSLKRIDVGLFLIEP